MVKVATCRFCRRDIRWVEVDPKYERPSYWHHSRQGAGKCEWLRHQATRYGPRLSIEPEDGSVEEIP